MKLFWHVDTLRPVGESSHVNVAKPIGLLMDLLRPSTIKDVASLAGVSTTTVSHVLNEVPGKRINSETRTRVKVAAADLSYRPNRLAQGLRLQRTHTFTGQLGEGRHRTGTAKRSPPRFDGQTGCERGGLATCS